MNTIAAIAITASLMLTPCQPLTPEAGTIDGPSGKETYYNLPMEGVLAIMEAEGYQMEHWVRDDGVKMYGPYVMVAADLTIRPRGTILRTSLGAGIVCDTGDFAQENQHQIDIATAW